LKNFDDDNKTLILTLKRCLQNLTGCKYYKNKQCLMRFSHPFFIIPRVPGEVIAWDMMLKISTYVKYWMLLQNKNDSVTQTVLYY